MLATDTRWTDEMDAALKQLLVVENKPARFVAGYFTERFGRSITKNAIIGRSHRIGLPKGKERPSYAKPSYEIVKSKSGAKAQRSLLANVIRGRAPDRPLKSPERLNEPTPLLTSLIDLTNVSCRWRCDGDEVPAIFCGHYAHDGKWCDYHRSIVYPGVRR